VTAGRAAAAYVWRVKQPGDGPRTVARLPRRPQSAITAQSQREQAGSEEPDRYRRRNLTRFRFKSEEFAGLRKYSDAVLDAQVGAGGIFAIKCKRSDLTERSVAAKQARLEEGVEYLTIGVQGQAATGSLTMSSTGSEIDMVYVSNKSASVGPRLNQSK